MNKRKHRLKAVQSMDELRPALSRERYDLVLLNLSDALKLKQPVQSAPSDPLAVPVVNAPDASFQPINERKVHGPAPRGGEAHRSLISV